MTSYENLAKMFEHRLKSSENIISATAKQNKLNAANAAEKQTSNNQRVNNIKNRFREVPAKLAARAAAKAPPPANMPIIANNTNATAPSIIVQEIEKILKSSNDPEIKTIIQTKKSNIIQRAKEIALQKGISLGNATHLAKIEVTGEPEKGGTRRHKRYRKKLTKKNRSRKSK